MAEEEKKTIEDILPEYELNLYKEILRSAVVEKKIEAWAWHICQYATPDVAQREPIELERVVIEGIYAGEISIIAARTEVEKHGLITQALVAVTSDMQERAKTEEAPAWMAGVLGGLEGWMFEKVEDFLTGILDTMERIDMVDEELLTMLREKVEEKKLISNIAVGALIVALLGSVVGVYAESFMKKQTRHLNKKYHPDIPSFQDFMRVALFDETTKQTARELMEEVGIEPEHFDTYLKAAKRYLDIADIMALRWRGELSDTDVDDRLAKAGFTGIERDEIKKLFERIPPIPDIIRMGVREAWRDDVAEKFGYDEDYPAELGEWSEKQGYRREWAQRYWRAHWELPSALMGYDMLHRGIISESELELLLRVLDIPKFWRERMIKLSYVPYTRVDVRRMHKVGVLKDEDLIRAYKDLGYDDEKAANMAEFTIRYNRGPGTKLSKAQIIGGFKDKIIDKDLAIDMLQSVGYEKSEAVYLITLEEYKEVERLYKQKIKTIEKKYKLQLIDTISARQELGELNVHGEKQDALIEEWDIELLAKTKKPTEGMLANWYLRDYIDENTYVLEMLSIGWPKKYIELFKREIDEKKGI